jgi:diguanylate cyclase (GGDEF)-like protein
MGMTMVLSAQIAQLKRELAQEMEEDVHNLDRICAGIEQMDGQQSLGPFGALLMALTGLPLDEAEAVDRWKGILQRQADLSRQLNRPVGLRTALLDYFIDRNRNSRTPHLIQVSLEPSQQANGEVDPVSGLLNAEALSKNLHREIQRAKRFRTGFSLLLLEIDRLHELLERHGSANLAFLQRDLGTMLGSTVRDIDLGARLGPGRFGILLPETDRTGAYLVAERFRNRRRQHFEGKERGGQALELTVSAGIASFPEDAGFVAELMERAEQALFQARSRGRDHIGLHYRERREYIRFEVDPTQVKVDVVQKGEPQGNGSTGQEPRDISPHGVLLVSPKPYPVGQAVSLICNNLRDLDQIVVQGRVVRIEEMNGNSPDSGSFEIGLAFDTTWEHQVREINAFLERLRQPPH